MKYLIVNADDLGLSPGTNRGIVRAHDHGIVTSASLMVRRPAAQTAADLATQRPTLSVGLHLDLGDWSYRGGEWVQTHFVVPAQDPHAVRDELARQLDAFRRLVGRQPTHVDSHQHVHRDQPARSAVLDAAARIGVPVRHFCDTVRYRGDFYGQDRRNHPCPAAISPQSLIRLLDSLEDGVTELACHPGEADRPGADYDLERATELQTLCHPTVSTAIRDRGIQLIPFHQIPPRPH